MTSLSGGCLCGAVRYEARASLAVVACHCTHCRRQSGSAFSVNVVLPQSELRLTGSLQVYHDKGESGAAVERNFCPTCGSPIFSAIGAAPGIVALKAGTLDDPDQVSPTVQVYCDSAVAWAGLETAAAKLPRAAPAGG